MSGTLSLAVRMSRLTALRDYLDSNTGGAVQFYDGSSIPAKPEDVALGNLLATVQLAKPSGSIAFSGQTATYTMSVPRVNTATSTGVIGWCRLVDGYGNGVIDLPVVKVPLSGPVVVSDTTVYSGGEVQLISCVISE
jgi:hypothetical protein